MVRKEVSPSGMSFIPSLMIIRTMFQNVLVEETYKWTGT